jgi:hypothetical protein
MHRLPAASRHRVTAPARATLWLAVLSTFTLLACDQDKTPTSPPAALESNSGATPAIAADVTALGTVGLPVNQSVTSNGVAFGITQLGTGADGAFKINNSNNTNNALLGQTNGSGIAVRGFASGNNGRAGWFEVQNSVNNQNALTVRTSGTGTTLSAENAGIAGPAGVFFRTGGNSNVATLIATSPGGSPAIQARALGSTGAAAQFDTPGTSGSTPTLDVASRSRGHAGYFHRELGSAANSNAVLRAVTAMATGDAGSFEVANSSSSATALTVVNQGSGYAMDIIGTTSGVRISTSSGTGLKVLGGSKQAVVNTATGARSLYTEESSEVWFTDYGFGRLQNGRARILIDPGFAQTVSLEQPYHVFVQAYGDAEIYVEERTDLGFVVVGRGGDPDAEFGYRLVAKRAGFEDQRLERDPSSDQSPAFDTEGR